MEKKYQILWEIAEKNALYLLTNHKVFHSYTGRDVVCVFMIMFVVINLMVKKLDGVYFYEWYLQQTARHLPIQNKTFLITHDTFYDDLLLCVQVLRPWLAEKDGVSNPLFILGKHIQHTLNSCNKSIAAKKEILKQLNLVHQEIIRCQEIL